MARTVGLGTGAVLVAIACAVAIAIGVASVFTVILLGLIGSTSKAKAHDIYTNLRAPGVGQLCCGGDPVTGDCEAVDDYEVHIDGSVSLSSRRYGARVLVDAGKVTWLPVPGGEDHPVHWCGKPRGSYAYDGSDQIDPAYWTFCLFVTPGGV